jgi:hypothetical protein
MGRFTLVHMDGERERDLVPGMGEPQSLPGALEGEVVDVAYST